LRVASEEGEDVTDSLYERIYEVTRRIPAGKVATYGQIARMAGIPKGARQVGYAMAALGRGRPRPDVPWHRVVNAKGESSIGGDQIMRLEAEGVAFDERGRIDLSQSGWDEPGEGGLFG
jgi:methylated-DNA-protein-cysteine methyltransferase-like protein